jgi:hypothetical protein
LDRRLVWQRWRRAIAIPLLSAFLPCRLDQLCGRADEEAPLKRRFASSCPVRSKLHVSSLVELQDLVRIRGRPLRVRTILYVAA